MSTVTSFLKSLLVILVIMSPDARQALQISSPASLLCWLCGCDVIITALSDTVGALREVTTTATSHSYFSMTKSIFSLPLPLPSFSLHNIFIHSSSLPGLDSSSPATTFQVLGLGACTTMPGQRYRFLMLVSKRTNKKARKSEPRGCSIFAGVLMLTGEWQVLADLMGKCFELCPY